MSFFYFNVKSIRRALGSSAVAAAAYRSASRLYDERQGRWHNYADKPGVLWSKILTPADQTWAGDDRSRFWNGVEAREQRADAVVAREILFALPRDLSLDGCVDLATTYLRREFCDNNLIVDLNLHEAQSVRGPNRHAHALVSTRSLEVRGDEQTLSFGLKRSDIFGLRCLYDWRRSLAEHANTALAEAGVDLQLDPRTYRAQGVRLEPGVKVGAAAAGLKARGLPANRARDNEEVALRNGDRIIADPTVALDALTWERSTFRRQDLERFLETHCCDEEQRRLARRAIEASQHRICVGKDPFGEDHFTSKALVHLEAGLEALALSQPRQEPHRLQVLTTAGEAGPNRLTPLLEAARRNGVAVAGAALSRMAAERLHQTILAPVHVVTLDGAPSYGQAPPPDPCGLFIVAQADLMTARQLRPLIDQGLRSGAGLVLIRDRDQERGCVGAALRAVCEGLNRDKPRFEGEQDLESATAAFAARRRLTQERTRDSRRSQAPLQLEADARFGHRIVRRFAQMELLAGHTDEHTGASLAAMDAARLARDRLEILWPGAERRMEGSDLVGASGLAAAAAGRTDALKRLVQDRSPDEDRSRERGGARRANEDRDR